MSNEMARDPYCLNALASFRSLEPLMAVCAHEAGPSHLFGGKAFDSRRLSWTTCGENKENVIQGRSRGFQQKPQGRSRENVKMWSSVKASKFRASSYTYNTDESVTSVYHTVTEGQTLSSIARQYETSIEEIALMNHIQNIDMIQAGQLLVVPVHRKVLKWVPSRTMGLDEITQKDQNMMPVSSISITPSTLPGFVISSPVSLQLVKATVPFLFMFPILAFCIRALVYSVLSRMGEETYNQKSDKENLIAQHGPKLTRWHGVLDGDSETEVLHISSPEYNITDCQENPSKDAYEEIHQSYAELEPAYLKFLAESGLSMSGYWRGGVPSSDPEESVGNITLDPFNN